MDELMRMFIEQTEARLVRIEEKLENLLGFKHEMKVSSKYTAFIVSGIVGFISVVISSVLTVYLTSRFLGK